MKVPCHGLTGNAESATAKKEKILKINKTKPNQTKPNQPEPNPNQP
jgi:hypothetical protein